MRMREEIFTRKRYRLPTRRFLGADLQQPTPCHPSVLSRWFSRHVLRNFLKYSNRLKINLRPYFIQMCYVYFLFEVYLMKLENSLL